MFTIMDDGRLPRAWSDQYTIKDVQRDVIAISNRDHPQQRQTNRGKTSTTANNTTTQATNNTANNANGEYKINYNRETDGKPCHAWNWGNDCGNTCSHGQHPDRKFHICAWCANTYHRTNPHQEKLCNNKKCYQDKKKQHRQQTTAGRIFNRRLHTQRRTW